MKFYKTVNIGVASVATPGLKLVKWSRKNANAALGSKWLRP